MPSHKQKKQESKKVADFLTLSSKG